MGLVFYLNERGFRLRDQRQRGGGGGTDGERRQKSELEAESVKDLSNIQRKRRGSLLQGN